MSSLSFILYFYISIFLTFFVLLLYLLYFNWGSKYLVMNKIQNMVLLCIRSRFFFFFSRSPSSYFNFFFKRKNLPKKLTILFIFDWIEIYYSRCFFKTRHGTIYKTRSHLHICLHVDRAKYIQKITRFFQKLSTIININRTIKK